MLRDLETGEVVLAAVRNPFENFTSGGKLRPAVLVAESDGVWSLMGLTTNRKYRTGGARVAVPDWRRVGLHQPGFLWGENLTRVPSFDIEGHLGWADALLANAIIELADLPECSAAELQASAQRRHGLPPSGRVA